MIIASSILNFELFKFGRRDEGAVRVEVMRSFDSSADLKDTDLSEGWMAITSKTDLVELTVEEGNNRLPASEMVSQNQV